MSHKTLCCIAFLAALLPAEQLFAQGQTWGDVKGRIVWGGKNVPAPAKLELSPADPSTPMCHAANKGQAPPDEKFVVDPKTKGFRDVFVWLGDPKEPRSVKPLPMHPKLKAIKVKQLELDQPACHFIPHAIALREGQTLLVKNSAPFVHSFKWAGDPGVNPGASIVLPPGAQQAIKPDADRLPIQIECAIHAKMRCWVRVFSHPYYALTGDDGTFEIKDAPAGQYRLMVWHADIGWLGGKDGSRGQAINIPAGKVLDMKELKFSPSE